MRAERPRADAPAHRIRRFSYQRDLADLLDICANVYGGHDYMPRVIHQLSRDPCVLVLAAVAAPAQEERTAVTGAAVAPGDGNADTAEALASTSERMDGVICADRRGDTLFLYGMRVRQDARGRGLGRLLMAAICERSPLELACVYDAPADALALAAAATHDHTGGRTVAAMATPAGRATSLPLPPPLPMPPRPPSCIVTATTSYNPAAQTIITRELAGPLYEVEGWPTDAVLGSYEQAAGWVRGEPDVPPGAPHMLDWVPGARAALAADAAAAALAPRWRRATSEQQLRAAVSHLLYGSFTAAAAAAAVTAPAATDGPSSGNARSMPAAANVPPLPGPHGPGRGPAAHALWPLLWLPMPYEVCPLDSAFVRSELAAGNVWLLEHDPRYSSNGGNGSGGNGGGESGDSSGGGAALGVMVLAHFPLFGRCCAGILAHDSSVFHSAVAHAASLRRHFLTFALRSPHTAHPPRPPTAAAAEGSAAAAPLPALYGASGGYRDFWVYGKRMEDRVAAGAAVPAVAAAASAAASPGTSRL